MCGGGGGQDKDTGPLCSLRNGPVARHILFINLSMGLNQQLQRILDQKWL